MKIIREVAKKCVISGGIYEFYEYEKPVLKGYQTKTQNCGRKSFDNTDIETKTINREKVLKRARAEIRRSVNANVTDKSKFVTLTFANHVTTFEKANTEFTKFIRRINNHFGYRMKYLVVPEFTKRGRIHFHVVFFEMDYIKKLELQNIWRNGFVQINKIDNVDNVGAYICKYLSKDSDKLIGKKCYFKSRNLKAYEIIEDEKKIAELQTKLSSHECKFSNVYENDYTGKVTYRQYVT